MKQAKIFKLRQDETSFKCLRHETLQDTETRHEMSQDIKD